jgi:type III pantothenate kinase
VDDDVRRLLGPYEVCGTTPGVIDNAYLTPETLGADRWAAINGAFTLARRDAGTAVLVIDAGTALTYDFATDFTPLPGGRFDGPAKTRGTYYGGGIAPGIAMRYRALHQFTARLPMLEPDDLPHAEFGRDTLSSLRFGVQGAVVLEAEAVVQRTLNRLPHGATLDVFLTGGDGPFLHKTMQNRNFASRTLRPDLAAYGARLLFPN